MEAWIPLVAAIAVALIANGAGYMLQRSQRNKHRADASGVISEAAARMVKRWEAKVVELEERVEELEKRVKTLEGENHRLRQGAGKLEGQVMSLGAVPVFRLSEMNE